MNKFERFAIKMSVFLFNIRIKDINMNTLLDDDNNQIPEKFINGILDDTKHQKIIKEHIRLSVLKDVTTNPNDYHMNGDDYVYSGNIYYHVYLVDEYVQAMYADTQTKTLYVCSHCNSDNVQVKAWVKPNQGHKFVEEVEGDVLGWCNDCNLNAVINTAELKKRAKVIGFQVVGEDDTAEEGKMHPKMDSSFRVYSLKQAREMLDDKNNCDEQWRLLTIWSGDIEKPIMMFEGDPRK